MTSKVVYKLETFFTQKGKHLEKKNMKFLSEQNNKKLQLLLKD